MPFPLDSPYARKLDGNSQHAHLACIVTEKGPALRIRDLGALDDGLNLGSGDRVEHSDFGRRQLKPNLVGGF